MKEKTRMGVCGYDGIGVSNIEILLRATAEYSDKMPIHPVAQGLHITRFPEQQVSVSEDASVEASCPIDILSWLVTCDIAVSWTAPLTLWTCATTGPK